MEKVSRNGFTLIEICLVMLIFGIAVSSLMALFPVSLRQGNQAVSDSVVTTFGDSVMNALSGRASSLQSEKNWSDWKTEATFKSKVTSDIAVYEGASENLSADGKDHTIDDYLGTGENVTIKYRLQIAPVNKDKFGNRLYRAILYVTDNKYAKVEEYGAVFVTYMFYFGEVLP